MVYNGHNMIRLLSGTVYTSGERSVIILTDSGVGYQVFVTKLTALASGQVVQLFTHLAVRETALDLYGFQTESDLLFFELLLTIPKIGPKSALQILDQASISLICESINHNDAGRLSKLSGMGKKTAEKIVQELQGKIELFTLPTTSESVESHPHYQDAFDTLITLGYNPNNIRQALEGINGATSTSDLVKRALKDIS